MFLARSVEVVAHSLVRLRSDRNVPDECLFSFQGSNQRVSPADGLSLAENGLFFETPMVTFLLPIGQAQNFDANADNCLAMPLISALTSAVSGALLPSIR